MKAGTWRKWAGTLKENTYALYLAYRDPRVPLLAKILIGLLIAYILSPIDLIPDFIPVIGYLDDLLLIPAAIWLIIYFIPGDVWRECQALAMNRLSEVSVNRWALVIVIFIWFIAVVSLTLWLWICLVDLFSG